MVQLDNDYKYFFVIQNHTNNFHFFFSLHVKKKYFHLTCPLIFTIFFLCFFFFSLFLVFVIAVAAAAQISISSILNFFPKITSSKWNKNHIVVRLVAKNTKAKVRCWITSTRTVDWIWNSSALIVDSSANEKTPSTSIVTLWNTNSRSRQKLFVVRNVIKITKRRKVWINICDLNVDWIPGSNVLFVLIYANEKTI